MTREIGRRANVGSVAPASASPMGSRAGFVVGPCQVGDVWNRAGLPTWLGVKLATTTRPYFERLLQPSG
jgi:hypothetical protein